MQKHHFHFPQHLPEPQNGRGAEKDHNDHPAPQNPHTPSQPPTASDLARSPPVASLQLPGAPHGPPPRPGTVLPHTSGTAVLSTRSRRAAASLSVLPGQLRLPPRCPAGRPRRQERRSARRAAPPTAGSQRSLPRTAARPTAAGGATADQGDPGGGAAPPLPNQRQGAGQGRCCSR